MARKIRKAARRGGEGSGTKGTRKRGGGGNRENSGKRNRAAGTSESSASFSGFAGPLLGDLIARALLAGADALAGSGSAKGETQAENQPQEKPVEPMSAPLEGEVEPARPGAAGVGMVDLAGYAMAIAVAEIASRFVASYERQMGNGPVVRQTAKGARAAANMAWSAFDGKGA